MTSIRTLSVVPSSLAGLAHWTMRRWMAALAGALLFAVAAGAPTDVLPNPLFSREIPVRWWSYPMLAATAALAGLVLATYVRTQTRPTSLTTTAGGGVLSALAIGCPVCNKLVVVLLGTSGALNLWAPLQPLLGLASLVLLGWALHTRLTAAQTCPIPTQAHPSGQAELP